VIGTAANVSDVPKAHELLGHFLKSCWSDRPGRLDGVRSYIY